MEPLPLGLPATVDAETVHSVDAVLALPPSDHGQILVGGWLGPDPGTCATPDSPEGRLIPQCRYSLRERPSSGGTVRLAVSVGATVKMPDPGYAVVLRVHTHDPLAASCKPESRSACEQAAVVDGAAWSEPLQTYGLGSHELSFFRYPASWRIISGYYGPMHDGPSVAWAVGTGNFDLGCTVTHSGQGVTDIGCDLAPSWVVPEDGVVVAWYTEASPTWSGDSPLGPSPAPGHTRVGLGACRGTEPGRCLPADMLESPTGLVLSFRADKQDVIEARWGLKNAELSRAQVVALLASFRFTPPAGTPSP